MMRAASMNQFRVVYATDQSFFKPRIAQTDEDTGF
jgi:hypothetical protein